MRPESGGWQEAQRVAADQDGEQQQGDGDAQGQRPRRAFAAALVAGQEEEGGKQAGDDQAEQNKDKALEHGYLPQWERFNNRESAGMRSSRRFSPKLMPTLGVLLLLPLLVELGLWQWHKADEKRELQKQMDAQAAARPLYVGAGAEVADGLRHRRVVVRGHYEGSYQFLLDNQVHGEEVGYDVLTPLRIDGGKVRVLVDRGWVPMGPTRERLPQVDPPEGEVEITGTVWQPLPPKFVLSGSMQPEPGWQVVWERIDLDHFRSQVPYPVKSYVVRLEQGASGSYVCAWPRPEEKVAMHLGYALQWFGMACVLLLFYLAACFRVEPAGERGRD